jgi:AraC-like DNA-binding protein
MTQVTSMTFALQESDLLRARATANRFDPHLHSTYSVVVLKSGTAEIRSERWSRTVRSGDVFFFNPYEVHSARCLEEGADYETLYPSREFIDEVVAPAVSGGALQIQTDVLSRDSHTDELLEALSSASIDNGAVETALRKVLALCAFTTEPSVLSPMAIARTACLLIRENCMRAMRTEDLARQVGVHKSHLVRAFTRTIGLAPQTYIRQVRVAKARELICAGSELSEVAQMLEFCDQAHLTREFKKVFGVPPGALSRDVGNRPRARTAGLRLASH